jgi:hypothetical protein
MLIRDASGARTPDYHDQRRAEQENQADLHHRCDPTVDSRHDVRHRVEGLGN